MNSADREVQLATWRDRRSTDVKKQQPLELWEILAEEFESDGQRPRLTDLDRVAEESEALYSGECQTRAADDLSDPKKPTPVDGQQPIPPDPSETLADKAVRVKAAYDAGHATLAEWQSARCAVEKRLFAAFHDHPRTALCLSGGGVRSATFGLGVIQGLAKFPGAVSPGSPLSEFDFLSTVSGGGYLGAWLSAWAARNKGEGFETVANALCQKATSTLEPEPTQLQHIRKYCAFLNPTLGALSADTWMLVATILRNIILNWTILIPVLLAALLVPRFYAAFLPPDMFWECACSLGPLLWIGLLGSAWGSAYILWHLPVFCGPSKAADGRYIGYALVPLTLAAIALSLHWIGHAHVSSNYTWWQFSGFGALANFIGAFVAALILWGRDWQKRKQPEPKFWALAGAVGCAVISGAAAGFLVWLFSTLFEGRVLELHNLYTVVAIPIILGSYTVAAMIMVGFLSAKTGDDDREWWSRAGGWILIVMVTWLIFSASVVYGPGLLFNATRKIATAAGTLTLGGIASWFGFSGKTSSGRREEDKDAPTVKSSPIRDLIATLAGPVFLLLLVAVLAVANDSILSHMGGWVPALPGVETAWVRCLYLLVFGVGAGLVCSWWINVNRFSLHSMYRLRLVRTYLGASHKDREKTVNRFIDMDDGDNVAMAQLSEKKPLHVVNMALNLVGGKNLAWQQRKAESFTSTRLRTGSLRVGYQCTEHYGGKQTGTQKGLTLGSAVAISGAAASPNMGYHSSPILSFVMTLFNARLGWWLANPGAPGKGVWNKRGPTTSFIPFFNEALGRTTDDRKWIYLSDGGHFENLGLYEMVLRRCKQIVVVDGSQDQPYNYEDLGNACRKIRVDLGIPIEFENGIKIFGSKELKNRYCGIGTIRYGAVDQDAEDGTILYIKACLNGTEPIDVLNYASLQPAFPQQGTEELWFNESQFESYRKLGQHIAAEIAEWRRGATGISGFIDAARAYIASPEEATATRWSKSLGTKGTLTGTFGNTHIKLDTDLSHH